MDSTVLQTVIAAAVVFGIAIIGLAIGVILSNRCLRGSCGGLGNLRDESGRPMCESCTEPPPECREVMEQAKQREKETSSRPREHADTQA